jgi:SHAQKYF class myb-like DNA-binding protein
MGSTLDFGYANNARRDSFTNLGIMGNDHVSWSFEEDKFFENSLASYDGSWPIMGDDYWGQLQEQMPSKNVQDIKYHFAKLEEDVRKIEEGVVPLPDYSDDDDSRVTAEINFNFAPQDTKPMKMVSSTPFSTGSRALAPSQAPPAKKAKISAPSAAPPAMPKISAGEQERRKGVPWTEEEHKLFLLGLNKFGKGDWRNISRNFVVSRTPTQVASHAQKYFIRLNSMNKKDNKRRSSIHDITSAKE